MAATPWAVYQHGIACFKTGYIGACSFYIARIFMPQRKYITGRNSAFVNNMQV